MELCRATLSRAPFLPAAPPSLPVRDFRKRRVVCLSSGKSESTESPKDTQMVVSVTGATGFIGRRLVQKLLADKHKVRVLTRSITKARFVFPVENFPEIIIAEEEEWKKCIEGSNAVVNLAGMPISTRWSPEIKKEIMQSRINVTSKVVDLINHTNAEVRPSVLAQVKLKSLMRLVLQEMTTYQRFSWIHLDDLVNLICQSLTNPSYKGVINGTAPNPVRLSEMCDQLGQVIGRPSWLPVPDFAIKAVLGEGASIVLEGQRVLPAKAKELGFSYKYPYVKDALKAIVREL
ncbi:epimerase family protein SDR39U1 homolog, chloroplastic isoform X7 [Elaeis guineensis]|uniref:Epimerase family protein SDR39U1 homolog, chloroplastic isoform X6 n=1 Tax=Elaeis guineensis var. tenera TaxID=51953 RepID=A0A6I9Q979_ELAGV|nr:epimerase family protein SDR39U1 homolog, chloroplastic isoform X6 [Elaeis guineensis]